MRRTSCRAIGLPGLMKSIPQLRRERDGSICKIMKPYSSKSIRLLLVAIAIVLFVSPADARHDRWTGSGGGRLLIKRAPDLGNLAYVDVKIDGASAAGLLYAQGYDGPLPNGRHIIQIRLAPTY